MKKDRLVLSAIIALLAIILALLILGKFILPKDKALLLPSLVKGVVYNPIPIGQSHQYDFWTDPAAPWIEDGHLMQQMGINTVRFFQPGKDPAQTRKVIGQFYQLYGIRSILGHWMDYWRPGNYADADYRQDLMRRVLEMVKAYKDEEGLLMWILGNENNLSWHDGGRLPWTCSEAEEIEDPRQKELALARIYYSLVNEITREIKKIDKKHPVALGNADIYTLEVAGEVCPDIDLVALTAYRGKTFGNLWREVKARIGKPVLIMEFGCDSFNALSGEEDQEIQSVFLKSQWEDIRRNAVGSSGEGNALGGCVFEWSDEWWKHDEHTPASWHLHNREGDWSCGGYYFDIAAPGNMNINEEWWGIVALSPETEQGLNKRMPRKVYYELQKIWRGAKE